MIRIIFLLITGACFFSSCRSTRKIQTVIASRDTTAANNAKDRSREDSLLFISQTLEAIRGNRIDFQTFSAKVEVDYEDAEGKKYDVTAHVRMHKDSVIWISVRAILGIEGLRAYITPDSVKLLDKQNNLYTARSVAYLQEVTALPLDLPSLQDLLLGNPVFLDSNVVSYARTEDAITLLSIGEFFKNLFTLEASSRSARSSKLDDLDELRNRTCYLSYGEYENKKGVNFSTKRHISVTEKKKLDIKLDYKQYDFNETLNFPFSVPKNYRPN
ncbi:MAG TPA: DUF4292 domain-containing protein [Chitinophagaceae bacterium]|nr:DUF4292 domain-containing protein [Chitinophagaceae bacterium]